MGNIKGSDHCLIGDLGKIPGWSETHITSCIGEIIGFHRKLTDEETSYIHQYLMTKWASLSPMLGNKQGDPTRALNFFSSEIHDKCDPLHVGQSRVN